MADVYTRYNGKWYRRQIFLKEDGLISASVVDDESYHGGAYTTWPEKDATDVINIIDYVAKDYGQELYERIYNHILNGSTKNNGSYITVAVHCAEKMKLPQKKLYEDFQVYYPIKIDYDAVEALERNCEIFKSSLESIGIKEVFDTYLGSVWYDRYGEIVIVEEPNVDNEYGSYKYMELPIVERATINEMKRRYFKSIPYEDEDMDNYSRRCKMLEARLKEQGIHRDIRRHIYCDKNGKEVIIKIPDFDDKNDYGSFSYKEKEKEIDRDEGK